jgi:NADH dehydrogenase (ubiquinone) 1 alpha/beta subcomplex 1
MLSSVVRAVGRLVSSRSTTFVPETSVALNRSSSTFFTIVRKQQPLFFFNNNIRSFASFLPREEVTDRIIQVVTNFDKVDSAKVSPSSKFSEDLGLDSLDAVEVVMAIEDEFAIEIPDAEADKIASIEDAISYIIAHPMAK